MKEPKYKDWDWFKEQIINGKSFDEIAIELNRNRITTIKLFCKGLYEKEKGKCKQIFKEEYGKYGSKFGGLKHFLESCPLNSITYGIIKYKNNGILSDQILLDLENGIKILEIHDLYDYLNKNYNEKFNFDNFRKEFYWLSYSELNMIFKLWKNAFLRKHS